MHDVNFRLSGGLGRPRLMDAQKPQDRPGRGGGRLDTTLACRLSPRPRNKSNRLAVAGG
jgi:hypothetical protein